MECVKALCKCDDRLFICVPTPWFVLILADLMWLIGGVMLRHSYPIGPSPVCSIVIGLLILLVLSSVSLKMVQSLSLHWLLVLVAQTVLVSTGLVQMMGLGYLIYSVHDPYWGVVIWSIVGEALIMITVAYTCYQIKDINDRIV